MVGNVAGEEVTSGFVENDKEIFTRNFNEVKLTPNASNYFEFRYRKNNGQIVWLGSQLTNLTEDPSINGLVMNSRDITAQRLAEVEQRMRAKMQALSENSPDLITRLTEKGDIIYINPVIEKLTGLKVRHILKNPPNLTEMLPKGITDAWAHILTKLDECVEKLSFEHEINTQTNNYIYEFNAIPEFDDEGMFETVLIVAHDITEQKQNEELILDKNKKITESINYSYRIQSALMPTEEVLLSHFENSFMLYKPKDIVSGDFPFISKKGDMVVIAAVDCTGHGVPGALMSFIGHFCLQQIMSENITDINAGILLDLLHARVQQTLKQDVEGSDSKDGMDVAMLCVNTKTMTIDYAGAHRPGYLIKDGVFQEIKSDKYPIAGMTYKTRKPFINTTIKMKKGDAIIFNTDGLPDQFGGTDGKQKFMSKKVRELIEQNATEEMPALKQIINTEFENWKGNYKQMDDVLMMGIKF